MTNLSKKVINAVRDISSGTYIMSEGLADQLGISSNAQHTMSQIGKGIKKEFSPDFKKVASFLGRGAVEFATGDAGLANAVAKKVGSIYNGMVSVNITNAVKKIIEWDFAGAFKSEESLIKGLKESFDLFRSKESFFQSGTGEVFNKFLVSVFNFAASNNFSQFVKVQDTINVKKYVEIEQRILTSPAMAASGINFTKLQVSKSKSGTTKWVSDELKKVVSTPGTEITIDKAIKKGNSFIISYNPIQSYNTSDSFSLTFGCVLDHTPPSTGTAAPKIQRHFEKVYEQEIEDITINKLLVTPQIISAIKDFVEYITGIKGFLNYRITCWIQKGNSKVSNIIEVPTVEDNFDVGYLTICEDINKVISTGKFDGIIPANTIQASTNQTSLPYFLASIGLCTASTDGNYDLDFSNILRISRKLSEGMVTGVFTPSDQFQEK